MDRGDIVWCNFDPSSGKEIQKTRPAVVISKNIYFRKFGLVMVCPITSTYRNWTSFVKLPASLKTTGYIMAHEIKTMDVKARSIRKAGESLDSETLQAMMRIVQAVTN